MFEFDRQRLCDGAGGDRVQIHRRLANFRVPQTPHPSQRQVHVFQGQILAIVGAILKLPRRMGHPTGGCVSDQHLRGKLAKSIGPRAVNHQSIRRRW